MRQQSWLNCTGKAGCEVVSETTLSTSGVLLTANDPAAGEWRIVVLMRNRVQLQPSCRIEEASLTRNDVASQESDSTRAHGAAWSMSSPVPKLDAVYAAFRIAGTPGREEQKNGLQIAVTPLTRYAP